MQTRVKPLNLPRSDNIKLAIPAILTGVLILSLGDAIIKQQSATFPLWQMFVIRSLIALPFLVYFIRIRSCATPIIPEQLGWTIVRSLILVIMWVAYYLALTEVPLSVTAASFYTSPLFITFFSAILIGERIYTNSWLAIIIGFVGVLLILQPQADDFNAYALLPILSAIGYALAMIMTRSKCQKENPLVLALWLHLAFVAVGILALLILWVWQPQPSVIASNPFVFGEWIPMWIEEWRLMAILAFTITVGSLGAAIAYQTAPSSIVATFDFSYIAFATMWGFLLFAEIPKPLTILGIILIVGGGLLAVRSK